MGHLKVVFEIGLTHPVFVECQTDVLPTRTFSESGNTVQILPPEKKTVTDLYTGGTLDCIRVVVERDCTDEQGLLFTYSDFRELEIPTDAARAFWLFIEAIREANFQGSPSTVAGYPVAPSREIQENGLVRTCTAVWTYNDAKPQHIPLGGLASIHITQDAWDQAVERFKSAEGVPPYLNFALDAAYFATSDPIRAIVMACAAWEVALRSYLANVASTRDPAYLIASRGGNIPRLYSFACAAKGGPVFHDMQPDPGLTEFVRRQTKLILDLPTVRNKLLHEGETSVAADVAESTALTVLNAIEWLFR